jgi:hypothetical protein
MPDNLKITTPISTNEGINKLQPSKRPNTQATINPAEINQPGVGPQAEQNPDFSLLLNRNSVFSRFAEQFAQTPKLTETMQQILFDLFSRTADVEYAKSVSPTLNRLASAMKMDGDAMVENLMFQGSNQTKFSAPVFDQLREIASRHPNSEFHTHLANLLKAYDSFFSIGDTTNSIVKELNTLIKQIPNSFGVKVQELAAQLRTDQPVENLSHNLTVLKEKIIPLLSQYVNATNDFGRARNTITLLVHDISRLNVGSRQEMADQFSNLMDYCRFQLSMPADELENLKSQFIRHLNELSRPPENSLYNSLLQALEDGPKPTASGLNQSLYKDTIQSLLLNNSVYMPYTHLFLPVNYQGQFLFAEIWVEKDDQNGSTAALPAAQKPTRLLLNFEIKGLGYFEASIELMQTRANVSLTCPASLAGKDREISSKISEIFTKNGLTADTVRIEPGGEPLNAQKIMKRIYERKSGIDVSV